MKRWTKITRVFLKLKREEIWTWTKTNVPGGLGFILAAVLAISAIMSVMYVVGWISYKCFGLLDGSDKSMPLFYNILGQGIMISMLIALVSVVIYGIVKGVVATFRWLRNNWIRATDLVETEDAVVSTKPVRLGRVGRKPRGRA